LRPRQIASASFEFLLYSAASRTALRALQQVRGAATRILRSGCGGFDAVCNSLLKVCISFDGKSSDGTASSAQVADRTEFVYLVAFEEVLEDSLEQERKAVGE